MDGHSQMVFCTRLSDTADKERREAEFGKRKRKTKRSTIDDKICLNPIRLFKSNCSCF